MRAVLLLMSLAAAALADGNPSAENSRRILREAESHVHELQRLNATDALLEVQLRIAKKLHECRQTGYPCPGSELIPSSVEEADDPSTASVRAVELPRLINTYQGRAQLRLDNGQQVEVRVGQRLGPWQIHSVSVDSLEVLDPEGSRFRIPVESTTP